MKLVKPGLLYRLEVGPEFLFIGEVPKNAQQPAGFGRVDGELMPQYIALYGHTEKDGGKWQIVDLTSGHKVSLALVTHSQISKQTSAMALLYANRSKYLFTVNAVQNASNLPLKDTLLDPAIQAAFRKLKPVDFKQFESAVLSTQLATSTSTPGSSVVTGVFEQMVGTSAKGWVFNPKDPSQPVDVLIRNADGELVGFGEASLPRGDLAMLGICNYPAGFLIPISPRALNGSEQQLYAIDEATDELIQLAPVSCKAKSSAELKHLLMDLPTTLEHLQESYPDCDAQQQLLLEKVCVLLEHGQPEAKSYLAAFMGADHRLAWLLEVKRAELALLAGQKEQALNLLTRAQLNYPLQKAALRLCENLIRMNNNNFSAV